MSEGFIVGALSLSIAIAWNTAITESIKFFFDGIGEIEQFWLFAIIITIFSVLINKLIK